MTVDGLPQYFEVESAYKLGPQFTMVERLSLRFVCKNIHYGLADRQPVFSQDLFLNGSWPNSRAGNKQGTGKVAENTAVAMTSSA